VKPNTLGFTQGAPSFPLRILHHAEVSLPQIRFVGARDMWPPVSCMYYLGNSMVRFVWGPC
jgi:hypothetical protein